MARVAVPTPFGEFDVRAYEGASGFVHLALCKGDIGDGRELLVRVHSECLTGDALGSLRCDCGPQLRASLRAIAAEGRGVLVYATGHEGRGIGLLNKLRAYTLQDRGDDTIEANEHLGLPADARDYGEAAAVLRALGAHSVRLLTNNPAKVAGLESGGLDVDAVVPLATAPHAQNVRYLRTKRDRLGHTSPSGPELNGQIRPVVDATSLLGEMRDPGWRPFVVLKFAQTLDGRIATATGDSRWISGEDERRVSHALRAACDAVLVGTGTVLSDDPQLTVRMVEGPSPIRVLLDSALRVPLRARILDDGASTVVLTTDRSARAKRMELVGRGVGVSVVDAGPGGVSLPAALRELRQSGVRSVLVEGGARVLTSFLAEGVADRIVVGIAPTVIGAGLDSVGELNVLRVADGIHLSNRSVHLAGADLLIAGDVARAAPVSSSAREA